MDNHGLQYSSTLKEKKSKKHKRKRVKKKNQTFLQRDISSDSNVHFKSQLKEEDQDSSQGSVYVPEAIDDFSEEAKEPLKLYKTRKLPIEGSNRNIKILRNAGKAYINTSNKLVSAAVFDPDSTCCRIEKAASYSICAYGFIPVEERQKMHTDFWAMGNYQKQNKYLFGLIECFPLRAKRDKKIVVMGRQKQQRKYTHKYYLNRANGAKDRVCLTAFLRVFSISKKRVTTVTKKKLEAENNPFEEPPMDRRGRHKKQPTVSDHQKIFALEHMRSVLRRLGLPMNPSQRCVKCRSEWYDHYVAQCHAREKKPLSFRVYRYMCAALNPSSDSWADLYCRRSIKPTEVYSES